MQKPAAEALARVHTKLKQRGYGLLVFDAYRPWHVTKMFWDATPEKFHNFVADPSKGSRHNRGCAVDLALYDVKTGKPVEMVSGYDEFSDRAFPDYTGGTSRQRSDSVRKSSSPSRPPVAGASPMRTRTASHAASSTTSSSTLIRPLPLRTT